MDDQHDNEVFAMLFSSTVKLFLHNGMTFSDQFAQFVNKIICGATQLEQFSTRQLFDILDLVEVVVINCISVD